MLANEIYLWFIQGERMQDEQLLAHCLSQLNEQEKIQQARFYFKKHRDQYAITRGILRMALSHYIAGVRPADWQFLKNELGKPIVGNADFRDHVYFNVSHTDTMIVVAISINPFVGVDVENINFDHDVLALADYVFSKKEQAIFNHQSSEEKVFYFFNLWTLKEAYLKAKGIGLSCQMSRISFFINENKKIAIFLDGVETVNNDWMLWKIQPNSHHLVALAAAQFPMQDDARILMREVISEFESEEARYPIVTLC